MKYTTQAPTWLATIQNVEWGRADAGFCSDDDWINSARQGTIGSPDQVHITIRKQSQGLGNLVISSVH